MLPADEYLIIFFDDECFFCRRSVQLILQQDRKKKFKFSSQNGSYQPQIKQYFANKKQAIPNSVLLFYKRRFLTKSDAALMIFYQLGGWWKWMLILWLIPPFIRDGVYDFIAKNRHLWFKNKAYCNISTTKLQERLIQ
ncbi:MAG: DUF393 domain-containing protein [Bacteroidetes bacterium]|nr:DUF393 domain-containing protein [Bacteroidota bacterium]